jgi:hypothetical protein
MTKEVVARGFRWAFVAMCLVLSVVLVWRGNTFIDKMSGPTMTVPVMCVLAALSVAATGLAVAFRANETQPA